MKNIDSIQNEFLKTTTEILDTKIPFMANYNEALNFLMLKCAGAHLRYGSQLTEAKRVELIKELILRGADVNFQRKPEYFNTRPNLPGENTPLELAVIANSIDVIELLLEYGAKITPHILRYTATWSNYAILQLFLNYGIDINQQDEEGTILHGVVWGTHFTNFLLNNGVNVNVINNSGQTPLHLAVSLEQYERAKLLIKHGAQLDIRDKNYKTPIECCGSTRIYDDIVKFIENPNHITQEQYQEIDPSLNTRLANAMTIAQFSERNSYRTIELLISAGADVNFYDEKGTPLVMHADRNFDILKLFLKNGANAAAVNSKGVNILMDAVLSRNIPILEFLLKLNIFDINAKTIPEEEDELPKNALDRIISCCRWKEDTTTNMQIAKLLIKNGLIINDTGYLKRIDVKLRQELLEYQQEINSSHIKTTNANESETSKNCVISKSIEDPFIPILDNFAGTVCSYISDTPLCNNIVQGCADGVNTDSVLVSATIAAYQNPMISAGIVGSACAYGMLDAGIQEVRTHLTGNTDENESSDQHSNCVIC